MSSVEKLPWAAAAQAAALYWERRAEKFCSDATGWRAVCAYDMPGFYNASIHVLQWLALRSWLAVRPRTRVLDAGCGVGRWSRRLARAGADVIGVDVAPSMVAEATRRATVEGLDGSCRFAVADLADLSLGCRFERILGVTVLQHIIDAGQLQRAVERLGAHLEPGGRLVLLEAAPTRPVSRCDTPTFVARRADTYQTVFARAGLRCVAVRGMDPTPFKTWLIPRYARWPRPVAVGALALATALSLPVDGVVGRRLTSASWHKVFVLADARERGPSTG